MSAQTGEAIPEGPASQRLGDRARFRIDLLKKNPNPIWVRELRQAARLTRTPFILLAVTIIITLIITAVGGSLMDSLPIDQVGIVLFQTFFSLAFFVVAWVGPALAANAIASEREGRTWEAVVLTGLRPEVVARGKFLAAYTSMGAYIVMLAPVGALPFLFGGIHALEVVIGFVFLFVIAYLAVAFGLAVSSKFVSSRAAIVVTLLLAVPMSGFVFGTFGVAFSYLIHKLWQPVAEGPPIWLPSAYVRGTFGVEYMLVLVGAPALAIALPGWFLYEATVSNLTEVNDDRSSGLKRWFLVTAVVLAAVGAGVIHQVNSPRDALEMGAAEIVIWQLFLMFVITMFMGEPVGASRRIRLRWDVEERGFVTQWLGPGLVRTSILILLFGVVGTIAIVASARLRYSAFPLMPTLAGLDAAFWRFTIFTTAYFVFVVGVAAWMRARTTSVAGSRILFLASLAGLAVVPWIVAAVGGIARMGDDALIMACVSPFYAFVLLKSHVSSGIEVAGHIVSAVCVGLGVLCLVAADRKAKRIITDFDERVAKADEMLAAEDAAFEEAVASMRATDLANREAGAQAAPEVPGANAEVQNDQATNIHPTNQPEHGMSDGQADTDGAAGDPPPTPKET